MSCDEVERWLEDGPGERGDRPADLERHLAGCESCRDGVERARALARAAAALPREVAPARDLWGAIRREIEHDAGSARPGRSVPVWVWRGTIAAAVALVAVGLAATWRLRQPAPTGSPASPASVGQAEPAVAAGDPLVAAGLEVRAAADEMLAAIVARRGELPPEAVASLERNLAIIDAAIAEIESALAKAPAGSDAERTLAALERRKVDVLWRVSRLLS